MAQLIMASMAGLRGSSQAVLEGRLHSSRLSTGNTARIVVARPRFRVRAQQQVSAETETSRRALLGLGAAGVVSGSFVQAVLAEDRPIEVGGPPTSDVVPGGCEPIKDPNNPEVVNVANFAVAEHNMEAGTSLVFASVDKGCTQVVAGINYKLVISAKDGGAAPQKYFTEVYSRPWEGILQLISFAKILR